MEAKTDLKAGGGFEIEVELEVEVSIGGRCH